ncbi:hypothetical protein [uncultured Zoogloea sp.]|uniref:hypothetical protein n=1 Tax=uncultured Zoogloea sp. TaxID=160237 RepID=UPI0026248149|nr:hypothetical protein [uncultured Zoogloea sp.]
MAFKTMAPEFRVTLYKTVARRMVTGSDGRTVPTSERYSGGNRVIDLTPFFGDGSSLETSKSVRQPAGQWGMTVVDQMEAEKMDSLYGLIEPMDVIEIRMRHRPDPAATGVEPPVVMRGFVSSVRRSMSMSADGRPARAVTISGADYGKVLEMIQIRYLPNYVIGQNLLTVLRAFVNYGIEAKPNQYGNLFVQQIVEKVINPFIADMASLGAAAAPTKLSYIREIGYEATANDGTISAFGAQSAQGTLWDILRGFLDVGSWTELFIEDRPDKMADPSRPGGVVLVYRNNPFKDLDPAKGYILPQRVAPETLEIGDDAVMSLEIGRSDADVANYFQVNMPRMNLIDAAAMNLAGQTNNPDDFYLAKYPNATPKLFGMRFMETDTQMGGADSLGRADGQSAEVVKREQGKARLWIDDRRAQLMAQNKDNAVFEDGSITLRGQCTLRPGMYLRIFHGGPGLCLKPFVWECYVVAVQHRMVPFQGFVTVATFKRGTSFAARIRNGAGRESAYLAEWNQGGALG